MLSSLVLFSCPYKSSPLTRHDHFLHIFPPVTLAGLRYTFRFLPTPIVAQQESHRQQLENNFLAALKPLLKEVSLCSIGLSTIPMYRNTNVSVSKTGAANELSELRPRLSHNKTSVILKPVTSKNLGQHQASRDQWYYV